MQTWVVYKGKDHRLARISGVVEVNRLTIKQLRRRQVACAQFANIILGQTACRGSRLQSRLPQQTLLLLAQTVSQSDIRHHNQTVELGFRLTAGMTQYLQIKTLPMTITTISKYIRKLDLLLNLFDSQTSLNF